MPWALQSPHCRRDPVPAASSGPQAPHVPGPPDGGPAPAKLCSVLSQTESKTRVILGGPRWLPRGGSMQRSSRHQALQLAGPPESDPKKKQTSVKGSACACASRENTRGAPPPRASPSVQLTSPRESALCLQPSGPAGLLGERRGPALKTSPGQGDAGPGRCPRVLGGREEAEGTPSNSSGRPGSCIRSASVEGADLCARHGSGFRDLQMGQIPGTRVPQNGGGMSK